MLALGAIKSVTKGTNGGKGPVMFVEYFLCNEEWSQPSAACLLSPGWEGKGQAEISHLNLSLGLIMC